MRSRAPWIAFLLVPLLALAGVLVPASVATADPGPSITTEVTAASADAGITVRVVGADFGATTGAYAAVIEKGTEAAVSAGGGYAGFGYWMTPGAITGGAFDKSIPVPTANLDRTKAYEVIVWQGHTAPDATTIYARADVTVTAGQWDAVFPPPPPVPTITTEISAASAADGIAVRVVGTDFGTIAGAYAAVIVKGTEASVSAGGGYAGFGYWMTPGAITGGAFDKTIAVPTSALDRTKQYEVIVWQGHTAPTAATLYSRADVAISAGQWNTVLPPAYGITVDTAGLASTGTVSVTGVFPASYLTTGGATTATGVYLMYCVQPAGEPGTGATGRAGGTGNCNSSSQKWVVQPGGAATPGTTQIGTVDGGVWTFTTTVDVAETFGTKACLDATTAGDGGVQCGIAVRLDHNSGSGAGATYTFDQFVPVTFAAPEPEPVPTITAEATAASAASGLTVRVVGSGFDGITGAYAAIIEEGSESSVGTSGGYAAFGYWMPPAAGLTGGAFDRTLIAPATSLDAAKQYEVIVWQGHSAPDATTIYDRADVVVSAEQWAAIFAVTPTITTQATAATASGGLTVKVLGSSFGSVSTAYAAIIEKGTEASVTASSGFAGFGYWASPGSIVGGAFDKDIVAATAKLDRTKQYEVIVWQAHSTPSATTIYARADVAVSPAQWSALFPTTENPGTVTPTPTPDAGSLIWGVKASFRSYVTGPIAGGAITTSGTGTSLAGYVFPQAGSAAIADGLGTVSFSGSVRFSGHAGALDLRLSDPQVRIDSATSGTLLVRVNGGERIGFASLALGAGTTLSDGGVRYTNASATLTPAGAAAFDSFYSAGTALDPVTFTIGSAGAPLAGTIVRASATTSTPTNSADPTPPATEGITIEGSPVEGGEITASADGFQPNETGILAVIYSTPTVLAEDLTADAKGRVSWTGTLPRGLSGEHTLTFQGSVDRGVVLDITAAAELQCTVSDASLVWGFKETFRAYIDGSIANGEWTTDGDVSYETPLFTWAGGTGGADLEEGALDVQYSGSVRFTGHSGALDTTIANPRVVVDGDSAVLLLDVTGTTQAGDVVEAIAVEFAELDLSAVDAARDGDTVTWADAPATLTAAGAAAFGTYPAGEALDPLTITTTVDAACGTAVEPTEEPTTGELDPDQASDGWPLWATILIIVVVLLLIAGLVTVLVRRNRAA